MGLVSHPDIHSLVASTVASKMDSVDTKAFFIKFAQCH